MKTRTINEYFTSFVRSGHHAIKEESCKSDKVKTIYQSSSNSWPTPGLNVCRMYQICQRCTSRRIQKVSLLDPQQSASLFVENTSDILGLTSDRPWVSLSEAVLVDPTLGSHLGQLDSSYMQSPFDLSPKTTKTTSQNNCDKTRLDCKDR